MAAINKTGASRWTRLISICSSLSTLSDERQLLDLAVRDGAELFGADCAIALLQSDQGLIPAAWVGVSPATATRLKAGIRDSLSDRALRSYLDPLLAPASCARLMKAPMFAGGKDLGLLVVCDIGERREAFSGEEAEALTLLAQQVAMGILNARLSEESERHRLLAETIIEHSPVAISLFTGPEHRYGLVNAARERLTGSRRGDLLDRPLFDVYPELSSGPVADALDRAYLTGENVVIPRYRLDNRDISVLYVPLRSPGGQVESVISLMLDITEQSLFLKEKESLASRLSFVNEQLVAAHLQSNEMAELAQQRAAELEAILSSMVDVVLACDPNGKITLMNSAAREALGDLGKRDVIDLDEYMAAVRPRYLDRELIPKEELAFSRALRGEVVRGMEQYLHDFRLRQDRYVLVSSAPVRDERGRFLGAVAVRSDITRLKEVDLLKDQFITVAAHEIKTPVTAMKGFSQALMKSSEDLDPKVRKALEIIVRESDRITSLVKEFQEVSTLRWGRVDLALDRFDLTGMVADVVAQRADKSPAHRLVTSRKDPAWVMGDRQRLDEVLVNLLDNAIRYSPSGGRVDVQVATRGDWAIVSVKDEGVGIPENRQQHIFERLYRAHLGTPYDFGGLGVGLYISREIVRRLGGDMGFESREGVGSTFYFTLPLAPP